jgi:hypothetical protein
MVKDTFGELEARPPLMPMNRVPSRTKLPDKTVPGSPGPASVVRLRPSMCEFGKIDV